MSRAGKSRRRAAGQPAADRTAGRAARARVGTCRRREGAGNGGAELRAMEEDALRGTRGPAKAFPSRERWREGGWAKNKREQGTVRVDLDNHKMGQNTHNVWDHTYGNLYLMFSSPLGSVPSLLI